MDHHPDDRGDRHDREQYVALAQRVHEPPRVPAVESVRDAFWWKAMDWSQTSEIPQGSAAARKTTAAEPTAVASARTRPPRSSRSPTGIAAGITRSLIERAAPIASPTATARNVVGRARYANASATAVVTNASAGPSPLIGAVTHNIEPLVATRAAASTAPPRARDAAGDRVRGHRDDRAGRETQEPGRVERAEADQVGDPEQRELERALRREDLAERAGAVAHREHRRAVHALVEGQRARGEQRGEADDDREEGQEGGVDPPGAAGSGGRRTIAGRLTLGRARGLGLRARHGVDGSGRHRQTAITAAG